MQQPRTNVLPRFVPNGKNVDKKNAGFREGKPGVALYLSADDADIDVRITL